MPQVNLSEAAYNLACQRAAEAGFASVEEYIEDLLQSDSTVENLDRFFTPERLAHIDRAATEMDAGLGITLEEFDRRFAEMKDQWLHRQK